MFDTDYNTDWDVDKYKNEYESEDHWRLRKQFMLAHKKKFPELRLVCLTQVFFNMEFLGCKYPQKTMDLVNKLATEVAEDFRESRKDKLKRTFVGAQDAAGAKAKGAKPPSGAMEGSNPVYQGSAAKHARVEEQQFSAPSQSSNSDEFSAALRELAKTFTLMIPPRANSKTEEDPVNIMFLNFTNNRVSFRFTGSKEEGGWKCDAFVNPPSNARPNSKPHLLIASSFASTQRQGKRQTAQMAIDNLKKYCSYVKPNPEWFQEGGTPEFIKRRIPCNKNPRTYLIMTKRDTGHISPEVADLLLDNFKRSSNEDMFFPDVEYTEAEKIQLMNRSQNHQLGFRHFGNNTMLKDHHVCIFKQRTAYEIMEEASKMGWKHPKYIIHRKN